MRQAEVFAGRIQRASGSGTDQSSVAAGWALPALADPHSLSWTAGVGESSEARRALPEVGSRGQAVIDQLQATVTELDVCEHGCGDFAFWIVTSRRPNCPPPPSRNDATRPRGLAGQLYIPDEIKAGDALRLHLVYA